MRNLLALVLPVLLSAQAAVLQIRAVDPRGTSHPAGSRTPGLTVEITDEMGKPVAGAVVSIRLPEDGPGGEFASGLASEIVTTGADGRAVTPSIRWNRLSGAFQVRVTAVKDRVRAGAIVSHSIAEGTAKNVASHSHRWRWIALGVLAAAGAAGAGYASGRSGGTASSSAAAPASPVQIGPPSITVGKP